MKTLLIGYYPLIVLIGFSISLLPFNLDKASAQVANVTVDIPAPHGGNLGLLAAGFAVQSRTRNFTSGFNPDGNVAFSAGLGDTDKAVGVILTSNIFGLSNNVGQENNFGAGTLDVQLTRNINNYIFVGAGVRGLVKWRSPITAPRDTRSFFLTTNYIIPIHRRYDEPFSLFFITAGIGNGIYRLSKDFDPNNSGKFNLFGSMALQVFRGGNVIVEWNGYELLTGLSVYPFRKIPALGGTFSVTGLTEDNVRFVFSMGYSLNVLGRR